MGSWQHQLNMMNDRLQCSGSANPSKVAKASITRSAVFPRAVRFARCAKKERSVGEKVSILRKSGDPASMVSETSEIDRLMALIRAHFGPFWAPNSARKQKVEIAATIQACDCGPAHAAHEDKWRKAGFLCTYKALTELYREGEAPVSGHDKGGHMDESNTGTRTPAPRQPGDLSMPAHRRRRGEDSGNLHVHEADISAAFLLFNRAGQGRRTGCCLSG